MMRFAWEVSSRVAFMEQGRIVEDGPLEQIFGAPKRLRPAEFLRTVRHRPLEHFRENAASSSVRADQVETT